MFSIFENCNSDHIIPKKDTFFRERQLALNPVCTSIDEFAEVGPITKFFFKRSLPSLLKPPPLLALHLLRFFEVLLNAFQKSVLSFTNKLRENLHFALLSLCGCRLSIVSRHRFLFYS